MRNDDSKSITIAKAPGEPIDRPVTPTPGHTSRRRGALGNVVVMALATGMVATVALPAYAFAPGSNGTRFGATAATEMKAAQAQHVMVDEQATTITVARDGYTATSEAELRQAEADARRVEVASQMAAYAAAYSGPSVGDLLSSPAYPNYDLASVYKVALQYQGVPYVYGGATPAGFDCSGFIMYVYAQFGIGLPHSSSGQGAAGTRISEADARPGDLVIMDGHDGFYAGNGNILHAPYEGASVRVQPIWTSNYYIVRLGI
ncbi:C40 family peptidase [Luethyella okanaganae]|uniref:C40 family peptidase n=1 Tax=Luethyella okanaganae TaxID=69372 RepID=A0ABW1VJY8_9MICO